MRKRKLAIILVRSFISMFIFSLIFISFVDFSTEETMRNLFQDIYVYSDNDIKEGTIENLDIIAVSLIEKNEEIKKFGEICRDKKAMDELKKNCENYYELRASGRMPARESLQESCRQVLAGDIEKRCREISELPEINITLLDELYEKHNRGEISDSMYFTEFVFSATGNIPEMQELEFDVKKYIIPVSIILVLLLALLFMLHKESFSRLLFSIGKILFNLGMLITIISMVLYIYTEYTPPDTSPMLKSFSDNTMPSAIQNSVHILVPLVLANLFSIKIMTIGLIMLISGIILKVLFGKRAATNI
ncbi:hypothetical protein GF323_06760 [Candidatus Woesearchaeota archaeon]|nr:hypothetical protein [Candidatus Woesearchaeota archaeon]